MRGRCPRASTTAARAASIASTTRARRERAPARRTPRPSSRASRCAPRITGTAISRRSRPSARSIAIASCGAAATRARASATISAVLHSYRFFFAFDARAGKLRWVYAHPRTDVVASEDAGTAIVFASADGDVGLIDPMSGAVRVVQRTGLRVTGASFDADGVTAGAGAQPPTEEEVAHTLEQIVWDHDARFGAVKVFAVDALGARARAAGVARAPQDRARRSRAPAVRRPRRRSAPARRWWRARIAEPCRSCSRRSPSTTTSSTTNSRAAST